MRQLRERCSAGAALKAMRDRGAEMTAFTNLLTEISQSLADIVVLLEKSEAREMAEEAAPESPEAPEAPAIAAVEAGGDERVRRVAGVGEVRGAAAAGGPARRRVAQLRRRRLARRGGQGGQRKQR